MNSDKKYVIMIIYKRDKTYFQISYFYFSFDIVQSIGSDISIMQKLQINFKTKSEPSERGFMETNNID